MTRRVFWAWMLCALLAATGCAQQRAIARAQARSEAGDLEGARVELERERELQPDSADVRVALGEAYYQLARDGARFASTTRPAT